MSRLESIIADLKVLPAPQLDAAADYIHRLRQSSVADRSAILQETSGALSEEDAQAVEAAIEEGCEKINARDW
jgi:hypothetical protein